MLFGLFEIILILVVIVFLFGVKKFFELMKGMGQGICEFKNEVKDFVVLVLFFQFGQFFQLGQIVQIIVIVQLVVDVVLCQFDFMIDLVMGVLVVNEFVVQVFGECC